jgi:hypothetical protein
VEDKYWPRVVHKPQCITGSEIAPVRGDTGEILTGGL